MTSVAVTVIIVRRFISGRPPAIKLNKDKALAAMSTPDMIDTYGRLQKYLYLTSLLSTEYYKYFCVRSEGEGQKWRERIQIWRERPHAWIQKNLLIIGNWGK